jgi:hypothetical protein
VRLVSVAAFVVLSSACVTSLGGFTGGGDAQPPPRADGSDDGASGDDAAATYDGDPGDAGVGFDAGDEPPPDLEPNSTFETGCSPPWGVYHSTLASDSTAHGGMLSCRVCWTGVGVDVFSIDDRGPVQPAVVGARYLATAWVRVAPDAGAPSGVQLLLRSIELSPFSEVEVKYGPMTTPSSTWQSLSITLDVTKPAQAVNVAVVGQLGANVCFLTDDVTLQRIE